MSAIKREAVTLYEQLRVVELKRNELLIEEQERGTPGQVLYLFLLLLLILLNRDRKCSLQLRILIANSFIPTYFV